MNADEKPPTIRQQIDSLVERFDAFDRRISIAGEKKNAAPPKMTEARALEACMDALVELEKATRDEHRYSSHVCFSASATGADRILRHLAARFGVPLVEMREQPCSRKHVDSLDDFALRQAIEAAAR